MNNPLLRLRSLFIISSFILLLIAFQYFGFWLKLTSALCFTIIISGIIFFSPIKWKNDAFGKVSKLFLILVFNVLFFIGLRIFVFNIYHIPSDSMERALVPGDIVLVDTDFDKQLNTSNNEDCKLSRNDIIVFNSQSKIVLVKRCIGLSGDIIHIKNANVYISDQLIKESHHVVNRYSITVSNPVKFKAFLSSDDYIKYENLKRVTQYSFEANLTKKEAKRVEVSPGVTRVEVLVDLHNNDEETYFFDDANPSWTLDNMGPLRIPKKGMTIQLNNYNYLLYHKMINAYENVFLVNKNNKFYLEDKEIDSYTFKNDYYFFLGDNRNYSKDSRVTGFVPSNQIIGKVKLVLFSKRNGDFDWSRFLKIISNEEQ